MIRKFTTSFIVLVTLVSISMAEPPNLLPMQPKLPPGPKYLPVSQATPQPIPAPAAVPESTHQQMLLNESCGPAPTCRSYPGEPVPFSVWWSNTAAGRLVHRVAEDTKEANRWPEPYVQYDRESEKMAFTTMIEKGWKRQNTLGNVHFDPNTGKLNMSGRLKVRHTMFEGLRSRRDLFVYHGQTKEETNVRLKSVKDYVHQLVGSGPQTPQVAVTQYSIPGSSGLYVDAITRKYNETIPDPRIPEENNAQFTED
jgi:hypothetical protein